MNYALAVLTSPRRIDTLGRTLASFARKVRPAPAELLCVADGFDAQLPPIPYLGHDSWLLEESFKQEGFCEATRKLWALCQAARSEWIFWLEDDFVFKRAVRLEELSYTLEREPRILQMSLLRQPVNPQEKAAGGVLKVHPERFKRMGSGSSTWFESPYWTTNPSLFSRGNAQRFDWPAGPECEGAFAINVREIEPQARYGVWGAGDVWVEHIGRREGTGY